MTQALHPGAAELVLLSSSRLTFLPMPPAGAFSFLEPAGSCLTAAAAPIQRSAFSLLYQALWGDRARGSPRVGPSLGGAALRPPPASMHLSARFPCGACLSRLLPGSGSTGSANGHNGRPMPLPASEGDCLPLTKSACMVAPPAISDSSSWGQQSLSGLSSQVTRCALSGFLPSLPFRVWSF